MAKKHSEVVMITDSYGRSKAMTLEIEGAPQLFQDAVQAGIINAEILGNAIADAPGRRCVIEFRLIEKDREGKVKRR